MTKNIDEQLNQLENGEIPQIIVEKEDFYQYREKIVAHPKFKHFRGEAKQGAQVIYTYLKEARS